MNRWSKWTVLALSLLVLTGCTRREEIGGNVVCSYQLWVGLVCVSIGVVLTVIGWFSKSGDFRGWIFFLAAAIGTVTFSPFGFVDHVTVTPDRLQTKWGFWCFPTTHDIAFENVRMVTLVRKETTGRRGRKNVSYDLIFNLKDGTHQELSATNSLMEEAAGDIAKRLAEHGVDLVDTTGGQ